MDMSLFQLINNLAGKVLWMDELMLFSAKYLPFLFALILVVLYLSWKPDRQRGALLAGLSMLAALGIAHAIAFLYPRPRPYLVHDVHLLIMRSSDPSFPSDHAVFSFAFATMIWRYNKKAGIVLIGVAALVGFSRVYVGTHYPTDVIGGAILGTGINLIIVKIANQDRVKNLLDGFFKSLQKWHVAAKAS